VLYFDASALAKRYIAERETPAVERLLRSGVPATSRLAGVEIASALARRCREGVISVHDRDRALVQLRRDLASMNVVELSSDIEAAATVLLLRHVLRAGDAIHLASCLHVASRLGVPAEIVAYDVTLAAAAQREGMRVVSPR
jgi:uncharacterized protein